MGGSEFAVGDAPVLESGRWNIKWQDGHRERYTSLTLRVDPSNGSICGTGRDSSGDCMIEGVFDAHRDRIAWTQSYNLRRTTMHVEVLVCECFSSVGRAASRHTNSCECVEGLFVSCYCLISVLLVSS